MSDFSTLQLIFVILENVSEIQDVHWEKCYKACSSVGVLRSHKI